jgi:hypothetical protein
MAASMLHNAISSPRSVRIEAEFHDGKSLGTLPAC